MHPERRSGGKKAQEMQPKNMTKAGLVEEVKRLQREVERLCGDGIAGSEPFQEVRAAAAVKDIDQQYAEEVLKGSCNMLQTVLDAIPSAVFWKDRNLVYKGGNRAWLKIAGLKSSKEAIGLTDYDMPWEREQADAFRTHDQAVMESGVPKYNVIEPFTDAAGRRSWARTNKIPLFDAEGEVMGVLGTVEDITARRQAEDSLKQSEALFRGLFENAPVAIAVLDHTGRIVQCNSALENMVGYWIDELIGKAFADFTHPHDIDKDMRLYQNMVSGGIDSYEIEKRYIHKQGRIIWAHLHAAVVRGGRGPFRIFIGMARDITDRKHMEISLREALDRQKEAVRAGKVGLWDWDLKTNKVHYSDEWKRQIGYEPHEIGDDFKEWECRVHPDDLGPVSRKIQNAVRKRMQHYQVEFRFQHKNESYRWIMAQGSVIKDGRNKAVRVMGSHIDITDQKDIEQRLRKVSRERQALIDSMINAFAVFESVFDERGAFISYRFVYVNKAFENITGLRFEEAEGKRVQEVWPGTEPGWIERYGRVAVSGRPQTFDMHHRPTKKTYHCHAYRPWDTQDRFCVVFEDITRQIAQTEQLSEYSGRLRMLSEHLQNAQEQERARLARELHDELGQALTALNIDLSKVRRMTHDLNGVQSTLDGMQSIIDTIDDSLVRIETELRPGILDDLGLSAALEWLAQSMEQRGSMSFVLTGALDDSLLNPDLSVALYRIVQEGLTNAAKHSNASEVRVHLEDKKNAVVIKIRDNGRGIRPEDRDNRDSFGLMGIRERILLWDGELTVKGSPGKGTTLTVKIPLARDKKKGRR